MKDERGYYYHPSLQDKDVRMYVRENEEGQLEFRLYNEYQPEIWDRHPWLSLDVIQQAAEMYRERGTDRNPMALYDEETARLVLSGK